ncbi:hypothetical protein NVP1278O_26 [Vibrio phage 1.278.O._10N.286.54.E8]|nr:hypothetical protein NVP1278O_26 [Vibrio phage 1.278.O._10N.286.54.E8]
MATRNLLHRSKLGEFKEWLQSQGVVIKPTKGAFEVLRWQNSRDDEYKGVMPIIYNGKSQQHLSCNDASVGYVRRFIREAK